MDFSGTAWVQEFVALRKESVDRNFVCSGWSISFEWSLSARRAWIEMTYVIRLPRCQVSLSARRAWIEIIVSVTANVDGLSLSARRAWIEIIEDLLPSTTRRLSLSARRAWIEILKRMYHIT